MKAETFGAVMGTLTWAGSVIATLAFGWWWWWWLLPYLKTAGPLFVGCTPLLDSVLKIALGLLGMYLGYMICFMVVGSAAVGMIFLHAMVTDEKES